MKSYRSTTRILLKWKGDYGSHSIATWWDMINAIYDWLEMKGTEQHHLQFDMLSLRCSQRVFSNWDYKEHWEVNICHLYSIEMRVMNHKPPTTKVLYENTNEGYY